MGWKGESRRHSLARKGIKTANGEPLISKKEAKRYTEDVDKIITILGGRGKYDYWNTLYPIVMNHVKHYQNDFLVHDKKLLENANEFVMGIRETGTDTYILDYREKYFENKTLEELLSDTEWVTRGGNDRFFLGKDGEIIEITKDEAKEIMVERIKEYEKERKTQFTNFPSATDSEIFHFAQAEIQDRKQYGMREEKVDPKKFYTRLFWSNSDATWHPRQEHSFGKETIKLDANEILLPFRMEEVEDIIEMLPPLPLYIYSHEHKTKTLMTEKEREQLGKEWASLQAEQFKDKKELL